MELHTNHERRQKYALQTFYRKIARITNAENCGLPEMKKCAGTMKNWDDDILNSFTVPYTNGFTEGRNNKIKVIKRNAYGYKNFKRFRNLILHIFNHNLSQKQAAA